MKKTVYEKKMHEIFLYARFTCGHEGGEGAVNYLHNQGYLIRPDTKSYWATKYINTGDLIWDMTDLAVKMLAECAIRPIQGLRSGDVVYNAILNDIGIFWSPPINKIPFIETEKIRLKDTDYTQWEALGRFNGKIGKK